MGIELYHRVWTSPPHGGISNLMVDILHGRLIATLHGGYVRPRADIDPIQWCPYPQVKVPAPR